MQKVDDVTKYYNVWKRLIKEGTQLITLDNNLSYFWLVMVYPCHCSNKVSSSQISLAASYYISIIL